MVVDAVLHPRGPEPPGVYWRRRVVLLAALVGAVVLLAFVFQACGGGPNQTLGQRSPSPTPSVSRQSTPRATSASPRRTPSTSPTATNASRPCRAEELSVTGDADLSIYPPGRLPRLTLIVTNTSTSPCTTDIGRSVRELQIFSGTVLVWSHDHCSPVSTKEIVVLRPGQPRHTQPVNWSRRKSLPGCPGVRPNAENGTYRVVAKLGDITTQGDVFRLR